MSGHSKWATIKRQKAVTDAKRGNIFTKLARTISVAVRTGGGTDPNFNFKLRMAVDKAKQASMPNDNIERAVKRGAGEGKDAIESVVYEGYGPAGSALIVEAITDNKNRTTANIRNIFGKHGGRMGEQGSVVWMFNVQGQILVEQQPGLDSLSLDLIDQGVNDVQESAEGLEIYTAPEDLERIREFIASRGLNIAAAEAIMRPSQPLSAGEPDLHKIQNLVAALEDDDDVMSVHTNLAQN